jgi:hypothetical protein
MSSVTIRLTDIDVATTMSSLEHGQALELERRRLAAQAERSADEENALQLLNFLTELLLSMRDVTIESHSQAVAAQRAGAARYDAVLRCPPELEQTFAYVRQLGDRVDRLCIDGVLHCRPSTPAERDHRLRLCSVIEAELSAQDLVSAGD